MVSPYDASVVTRKRCFSSGRWSSGSDTRLISKRKAGFQPLLLELSQVFLGSAHPKQLYMATLHHVHPFNLFLSPNSRIGNIIYSVPKPETWASTLMPPISSPFVPRLAMVSACFMPSLCSYRKFSGFTSCLDCYGRLHLASTIHSPFLSCIFHQETGHLSKMPI